MEVLYKGKKGPEVEALQKALAGLGFLPDGVGTLYKAQDEAVFEEKTEEAVNRFRATFGWDAHGQATHNTQRALRIQVSALQRKLGALGLYQGRADGEFNDATEEALRRFQEQHAATKPAATGRLDEATRQALLGVPPYTFDEVLCSELDAVNTARAETGLNPEAEAAKSGNAVVRAHQSRLLGLAFSGGGIRSATFNLGVLQALARLGLLRRVDYLSTVSGGGYIGGWLHAWVNREDKGILDVEQALKVKAGAAAHEPRQVSWLRQYSNYLTPRVGLLSADTMAGVATWLRNVLLNQTILGTLGLAVLCLPWGLFMLPHLPGWQAGVVPVAIVAGTAALLLAVLLGIMETLAIQRDAAHSLGQSSRRGMAVAVIAGAALAALLLGVAAPYALPEQPTALARMKLVVLGPPTVLLGLLLLATVAIGVAGRRLREASREWWSRAGGILVSMLLGWLALAGVSLLGGYGVLYAGAWISAMGGIAWLATTVAGVILGRSPATGNGKGGWKNLLAGVAPWVFVVGLLVVLALILHTAIVNVGGKAPVPVCQPTTETAVEHLRADYRISVQIAEGTATGEVLRVKATPGCDVGRYAREADRALASPVSIIAWQMPAWLLFGAIFIVLVAMAFGLSRYVDINVFAFHMFYRNRLERCYLGASNPARHPNPFTGLDPLDSPRLADLKRNGKVQRPYPLINTALNIARSANLAWQERKAASFLFTPAFCGYQLPGNDDTGVAAYQKTDDYLVDQMGKRQGWLALGTPVTISGAAASPNAGYHTNPATAFLMTVFNVRLGWWIQNTSEHERWTRPGPKLSIRYLLKELLASTTDTDNFVYVSDGGHFENLGIYELVRRRCRYIIASDAGCDPDYGFEDLGNAIRKCRIDLGIDIEIDPAAIVPDPETGRSLFHCAVGTIHYERRDPVATPGYLLYIKASLTGNEPTDVDQYKSQHPAFPHESTGDQWYSESQFESYRKLGHHVAMHVLEQARDDAAQRGRAAARQPSAGGGRPCDQELLFHALSEQWYPPSRAGRDAFSKHGAELEKIYDRMRLDGNLRFLDSQIYPEWVRLSKRVEQAPRQGPRTMFPLTQDELRAGFYLCNTLIQLMENVYTDLRLEETHAHPDNRGWMNLFRHWSWSGMFRVTWSVCVATYGARFQQFCRRQLGLESGELVLADPVEVGAPHWEERINFLEQEHVRRIIAGHYAARLPEARRPLAEALAEAMEDTDAGRDRLIEISNGWIAAGDRDPLVLRTLEMRVGDPLGQEKDFVFPVGFALLGRPTDGSTSLVYYRIQDHLRRMGLGRRGLRELQETYPGIYIDMPSTLGRIIRESNPGLLQSLWHLVLWATPKDREQRRG